MLYRYLAISVLLLRLCTSEIFAQELGTPFVQNLSFNEYNVPAQNWAITQDHNGLMYFGQNEAILQFDGSSWRKIASPGNSIARSLATDSSGRIWVGSFGDFGFLNKSASGRLRFKSLLDSVPEPYRKFTNVWEVLATPHGVFFRTRKFLFRWHHQKLKVWTTPESFSRAFYVNDRFFIKITRVGMAELIGDSLSILEPTDQFSNISIFVMLPLPEKKGDDRILIGTRFEGFFTYANGAMNPFPVSFRKLLDKSDLYRGVTLPNGSIALATSRNGVFVMNRAGDLVGIVDKQTGLHDNNVREIFVDREGGLFAATNSGLAHIAASAPTSSFGESHGLKGTIQNIVRFEGKLYAGGSGGIFALQVAAVQGDQTSGYRPRWNLFPDLRLGACWDLLVSDRNLLMATTYGVYRKTGNTFTRINQENMKVYKLHRSKQDPRRVFLGMVNGLSSIYLDGNTWRMENRIKGTPRSVRRIVEEEPGIVWLNESQKAVYRLDFTASTSTAFKQLGNPVIAKYDSFETNPKFKKLFRLDDHVIIATEKGLQLYDQSAARFVSGPPIAGLSTEREPLVNQLAEADDKVWIGLMALDRPQAGIMRKSSDGTWQADLAPFQSFAGMSVFSIYAERGIVWFGGSKGIVRFDTQMEFNYDPAFQTQVRKVSAGPDSTLFWGEPVAGTGRIGIPYERNAVRFEFSIPAYVNLDEIRYRYFLEGFDRAWSDWSAETSKEYTNLHEGNYVFRVHARNGHGRDAAGGRFAFYDPGALVPNLVGLSLVFAFLGSRYNCSREMALS